jgi:hypothetical protein
MNRFTPILSAILVVVMATLATAQKAVTPKVNGPELFALEDLRPGMKGTARTVFSGSDTQEFGVEVLGILPGFPGPRQSAIIAKLSGANVEKTGVFAGMSGSPVYIDGKIVGAIAFSFPFSKEPIAGITPIKQMIDLFNKGSENLRPKEPRVVSFSQLAGTDWKPNQPKPAVSSVSLLAPVSAGSPLMPLNTSGVAIGVICCPIKGISGEPVETGASSETEETAGFGRFGFQSVPASCENETTRGSLGLMFSEPLLNRSIICLIGVIPAIGSFENGKLKAIAPTILPSM